MDETFSKVAKELFFKTGGIRLTLVINLPDRIEYYKPSEDAFKMGLPVWVTLQVFKKMGMTEYIVISEAWVRDSATNKIVGERALVTHHKPDSSVSYHCEIKKGKKARYLNLPFNNDGEVIKENCDPRLWAYCPIEDVIEYYKNLFPQQMSHTEKVDYIKRLITEWTAGKST